MQPNSFKKGDLFEKFVEDELFKATDYVLISRTKNYDQNKSRYAEDALEDFISPRVDKWYSRFDLTFSEIVSFP